MSGGWSIRDWLKSGAPGVKRLLWLFLKYGISAACLVYVFKDVPLADLMAALRLYPMPSVLATVAVSFTAYSIMGVRLAYMTSPPLSYRSTFCATMVGLAVNNVLPAKAGEVLKALWLGRENGVSSQKTLGIVFMERFFDVNALALLSLWVIWSIGNHRTVLVFLACLAAGWCLLIVFYRNNALAERFTNLFGRGRLRAFVSQALSGVLENMSPARLAWLSVTSLTIWSIYVTQMFLCLNLVAGLGLGWEGVVSIFAVSGLSMLLPSSPGAIGVYEAFTVTLLKRYGVEPDAALAVALLSHMIQFIPVTLTGGLIFAAFPVRNLPDRQ